MKTYLWQSCFVNKDTFKGVKAKIMNNFLFFSVEIMT